MDLHPYANEVWARTAVVPGTVQGDVSSEERERHALVAYLDQHIVRPIVEAGRTRDAMEEAADALLDDGSVARASAVVESIVAKRRGARTVADSTRELARRLRDEGARAALDESCFWGDQLARVGPIKLAKGLPAQYPETLDAFCDQPLAVEAIFRAMNRGQCARWVIGVANAKALRPRERALAEMDREGFRAMAKIYAGSGATEIAEALRARGLEVPDFEALRARHDARLAKAKSLPRNVPVSAKDLRD